MASSPQRLSSAVQAIVAIDNPDLRRGIIDSLRGWGLQELIATASYVQTHEAIQEVVCDLLVTVAAMDGLPSGQLAREIRHSTLGSHPFPVVVMLLPEADPEQVARALNYGVDDLLLLPVSPAQLLSRLEVIRKRRKPFVVTADYIGPDRRRQDRGGCNTAPLLDVPNPLTAMSKGPSMLSLQEDFTAAAQRINLLKIGADGARIRLLGEAIAKDGAATDPSAQREQVQWLRDATGDLVRRTEGWKESRVAEGAARLSACLDDIPGNLSSLSEGQLLDLVGLCSRIDAEIRKLLPGQRAAA